MKRKELYNLAKKIAIAEIQRSNAISEEEKASAERVIYALSGRISNLTEMMILDELIQDEIARLQKDKNS